MKRAAFVVGMLCLGGQVAAAGTYAGLALGSEISTTGDVSYTNSDRTGKILLGYSLGQISIEGAAQRGSLTQDSNRFGYDLTQLSLCGKYNLPLADGFEAFGRVGYQHTGLSAQQDSPASAAGQLDSSGAGFLLGAGIEYRVNLVATSASIFLDYNFTTSSMTGPQSQVPQSLQTRGFTIGATVGF